MLKIRIKKKNKCPYCKVRPLRNRRNAVNCGHSSCKKKHVQQYYLKNRKRYNKLANSYRIRDKERLAYLEKVVVVLEGRLKKYEGNTNK